MSLLVFGTGQLGTALVRLAAERGLEMQCLSRREADLATPGACAAAIEKLRPTAVINAAAYTDVDGAEAEEALATRINGAAPGEMAEACAARAIPMVHVSTDYVFDGAGSAPHRRQMPTAPCNAYGRSKRAGEAAVRASGARHVILRTSWVFSGTGRNFLTTMLRHGQEGATLRVVADQVGGPTPAAALAEAALACTTAMQEGAEGGTYHFAGTPSVSWAEFARAIFAAAGRRVTVEEIATADWPAAAVRPLNSRLDCAAFTADFGVKQPRWADYLPAAIAEAEAAKREGQA